MDIATIIGLVGGTLLILLAIVTGGNILIFINVGGLLIVVGGTIATTFIKFSMSEVINSLKVVMKAFTVKLGPPEEKIKEMVELSRLVKKEGILALEEIKTKDRFSETALRFLVDGYDIETIEDILTKEINLTIQRHTTGRNLFKGMGSSAPAFGMIGTLIGLVQMLANMADPSSIGPAMAVALLTTLYGALMANLVCLPLADKLAYRSQEEEISNRIILEAAIGMRQGVKVMILEEQLKA